VAYDKSLTRAEIDAIEEQFESIPYWTAPSGGGGSLSLLGQREGDIGSRPAAVPSVKTIAIDEHASLKLLSRWSEMLVVDGRRAAMVGS
jgi:hypothetical protein